MNEFLIYEQLCKMSDIACQYSDGLKYGKKIREIADRMVSRQYRVAVIGEFKKGKSSLINALLGTDLLPTDILPMTAAITHVIYGEIKKIVIKYKNGSEEERTVEQLIDFATKYDKEKEQTARSIREIEVRYPSVFCKNHIEIVDTPGMNDNDEMSAITLSVLGDIDAAIMVISAKTPLSMTEQNLILTMIEEPGIHHIVFVVTHIDVVSDEAEEQDRLIAFIRNRIGDDLLRRAEEKFTQDDALRGKARSILQNPDIFGVSSTQAMMGFVQDREDLLDLSRFPRFKRALLSLLTAAQSMDIGLCAKESLGGIQNNIETWYLHAMQAIDEENRNITELQRRYDAYFPNAKSGLTKRLTEMDLRLQGDLMAKKDGLSTAMLKRFIKGLASIRTQTNTHEHILSVLEEAANDAFAYCQQAASVLEWRVHEEMRAVYEAFSGSRPVYAGCEKETQYPTALVSRLSQWRESASFPAFCWSAASVPPGEDLTGRNIILPIYEALNRSLADYFGEIEKYIASWRVILLKHNRILSEDREVLAILEQHLKENGMRKILLQENYKTHWLTLDEISKKLNA